MTVDHVQHVVIVIEPRGNERFNIVRQELHQVECHADDVVIQLGDASTQKFQRGIERSVRKIIKLQKSPGRLPGCRQMRIVNQLHECFQSQLLFATAWTKCVGQSTSNRPFRIIHQTQHFQEGVRRQLRHGT